MNIMLIIMFSTLEKVFSRHRMYFGVQEWGTYSHNLSIWIWIYRISWFWFSFKLRKVQRHFGFSWMLKVEEARPYKI